LKLQALQDKAVDLWKSDQTSARELGEALIDVREAMGKHGEFTAWWQSKHMVENRVYYCVRIAQGKVAAKKVEVRHRVTIEPSVWKRFRKICGGKQQDMAQWATRIIDAWCDDYEKKGRGLVSPKLKEVIADLRKEKAA
jgi:hypothetical protein